YHAAHLPFDPYFWEAYLHSPDSHQYLQDTSLEIEIYRKGKSLSSFGERELHLAYAGLDSPDGLSFEEFANKVRGKNLPTFEEFYAGKVKGETLPPPFLTRSFKVYLPEIHSIHHSVDKGKIQQALKPLEAVKDEQAFQKYLTALIQKENGSLKKIKPDLEAV